MTMKKTLQSAPKFSPLYRQAKAHLMQALQDGEWQAGQVIPSEQELAAQLGVSQGTVRKALDELVSENLLIRRQGRGTFVASHGDAPDQFRFLRLRPLEGDYVEPTSEPLECWRAKAGQEAAKHLAVALGEPIIIVRRLLKFAAKPSAVDEVYLPGELFTGLNLDVLQEWNGSLYGLYESRFNVRIVRAAEKIRAVAADKAVAAMLKVEASTPLLAVERIAYTYSDRPVEWRRSLYLTENFCYQNELV